MRLAIVHYHLKPGGVTRVVENAVASLKGKDVEVVAISGEDYVGDALDNTAIVPELCYSGPEEKPDVGELLKALREVATERLGGAPNVWHIHNHSLGKNSAMPEVVNALAEAGEAVLLQIHDFAEDGRPGNFAYLHQHLTNEVALYPVSDRVQYAVLNGRDYGFLKSAGASEERLHLLPNPVKVNEVNAEPARVEALACDRLFLYPTRAIRRKNMGEFVLASAVAQDGDLFASTLEPANPTAKPIYERWVAFSKGLNLPAHFGIAHQFDFSFEAIIAASHSIISTSVAEGFGLAFLEPWLMGRPLCGRDIADITVDFKENGLDLSTLYQNLWVPEALVDDVQLRDTISRHLSLVYKSYQRKLPENAVDQVLDSMRNEGRVEFGRLDESLQEQVIERIAGSPDLKKEVTSQMFFQQPTANTIEQNKNLIEEHYSIDSYGKTLLGLYQGVLNASPEKADSLDETTLLNCFLDPVRFSLLRT